jgi:hypothetical protein
MPSDADTPLVRALLAAAEEARDEMVLRWLTMLLREGEVTSSDEPAVLVQAK